MVFMPTLMPKRQQDMDLSKQEHCEILSYDARNLSRDNFKLFDMHLFNKHFRQHTYRLPSCGVIFEVGLIQHNPPHST